MHIATRPNRHSAIDSIATVPIWLQQPSSLQSFELQRISVYVCAGQPSRKILQCFQEVSLRALSAREESVSSFTVDAGRVVTALSSRVRLHTLTAARDRRMYAFTCTSCTSRLSPPARGSNTLWACKPGARGEAQQTAAIGSPDGHSLQSMDQPAHSPPLLLPLSTQRSLPKVTTSSS